MHHHGGVDAFKRSAFEHEDFASAALFSGRAEHAQPTVEFVRNCRRTERRSEASCRDDVVTARVTDSRQSVVFTEDGNLRTGGSGRCFKRRRQAVCASLNIETVGLEGCGQNVMGMVFCIVFFWMRMDGVGDLEKQITVTVDHFNGFSLCLVDIHV